MLIPTNVIYLGGYNSIRTTTFLNQILLFQNKGVPRTGHTGDLSYASVNTLITRFILASPGFTCMYVCMYLSMNVSM